MTFPVPTPPPPPRLDQISTRWSSLGDPERFVMRYGPAVLLYLTAMIRDQDAVEEVLQEFLLRGVERGFIRTDELRGRFRDYLKTTVRNAGLSHLRRRGTRFWRERVSLDQAGPVAGDGGRDWREDWRAEVLARAWQDLEDVEKNRTASFPSTILRTATDHPDLDSAALAAKVSALTGRMLRPEAFRKQLSRARQQFAALILREVGATLGARAPEMLLDAVAELGLLPYIRDFLPDAGHESGHARDA